MRKYMNGNTLKEIAELHSTHITVIKPNNGGEEYRKTTKRQRETLCGIFYGALLGLNWGEEIRSNDKMAEAIVEATEFQADILMEPLLREGETLQGYLSVYIPLNRILKTWERE